MTKILIVIFASAISMNCVAFDLQCSDSTGKIEYSSFAQEGGPCCGRSSMSFSYNGTVLKETQKINAGGPIKGSFTDSNPNLSIAEGSQVDLGNSTTDKSNNLKISYTAMNLTITSTEGVPVLPGDSDTKIVVSMVCKTSSNLFPVP